MAVLLAGLAGARPPLHGQGSATVRVAENLRAQPRGAVLGRLEAGGVFPVRERQEEWVQVEVEGWVWTRSLQAVNRGDFDLTVSAAEGENLREEPSGDVLGRLARGTVLERVESVPGWTRVRRVAWLWAASATVDPGHDSAGTAPPGAAGSPQERWWRSRPAGDPILSGPDGDTLARAAPGRDLQVLAREGNWIRVRVEGWVWAPPVQRGDSAGAPGPSPATPAEVAADPAAYQGRVVTWDLRFVSLERAEKVRTDFYEGEPFLLARTPAPENAFVYVALPPERLAEVQGLIPLERIRVVGRIRTGAAALTGNPILDLLELTRLSRR